MRSFNEHDRSMAQNHFKVPEGYFEEFAMRIRTNITRQTDTVPHLTLTMSFVKWLPLWGVACVVALVVIFTQYVDIQVGAAPQESAVTTGSVEADEAYDYLVASDVNNLMAYEVEK